MARLLSFFVVIVVFLLELSGMPLFAAYKGLEKAEDALRASPLKYANVAKQYLRTLESLKGRLVDENDIPSVYGRYISLLKKLEEVNVSQAADEYYALLEDPDQKAYRKALLEMIKDMS